MLVGTAKLTRLQDPNCTLSSEIPEIFKHRIVIIQCVSFPFPNNSTSTRRNVVRVFFMLLKFIFIFHKRCLLGKQEGWVTITGIVTANCRNCC